MFSLIVTLPMRGAFCSTQLSLEPRGERMNLCGEHFSAEALRSQRGSWSIAYVDDHGSWAGGIWIVLKPAAKSSVAPWCGVSYFHECCLLSSPGLDRNAQSQNVCGTGMCS